ncbi:hypothetical protein KJ966_04465 [bacterium]|nr:hypothetical protein [bacterium]
MLKFYGIRFNQNGSPERFSLSFAIGESLHAGLHICEQLNGDPQKTTEAVDKEIGKLFQGPESKKNNKKFRFFVAKWFRTKDIVLFLLKNAATKELKLSIAKILDSREVIENKWKQIEPLVLGFLSQLSVTERNQQLSDSESDVNMIMQMISLFFLEQDEEVPPANLELQFIRYQFPKIIWKKKDGFNAISNPFWLPKNMFCRASYLLARIISKIYEHSVSNRVDIVPVHLIADQQTVPSQMDSFEKNSPTFSLHSLMPDEVPDEIRLEIEDDGQEDEQLQLIPESVSETLLSLQKMIQKRFSHDGVKHLLGILRQFAGSNSEGYCLFSVRKHLELVAKPSKQGEFSEKQVTLFTEVFRLLSTVKVKRFWKKDEDTRETSNPFVLELYSECQSQKPCSLRKKIVLDPIFLPGINNPFHLGMHLRLIPPRLFRESIYKHPLLPGLASYLTGTWLNEFIGKRGVASKTTREVIEGCAFNIVPSNKLRIIDKAKSELAYMKEKCYISEYSCENDDKGNPWDDHLTITASENVLASIAEKMRVVNSNCVSEKLIA